MTDHLTNNPELPEVALTPRQREVLRILVQEYVNTATPVGSGTIQRVGRMGVSPATIRNEMGALEELGYIEQPHTSAGRVPTVKGYRYFVEQLMEQVDLPAPEQRTIKHQFHQVRLSLDQWMRLTATVLAHSSRAASLVTAPHAANSRFRHMELISIHDTLCLMILVLQDGSIHEEMLVLTTPIDQGQLSQASNKVNAALVNLSAEEVRDNTRPELADLQGWEAQVLQHIVFLMEQVDHQTVSEIYRDGLVNVLRQPEFVDATKFRQVLEVLEHRNLLERILSRTLSANGVQVIIGGEGRYEEIDDVSLVLSPYGVRGKASGVLGIMGPTRMGYARAISTVRYVALLMDGLIADMYGS
jgi:heat-inducible transcriptional repressor